MMITRRITRVGGPDASTAAFAAEAAILVSSLLTVAQYHATSYITVVSAVARSSC